MKAVLLTGINELKVGEIAEPAVAEGTDVLVRIREVGVCGSDVHYFRTGRIGSQVVEFPFIVGHECCGVVEQVGAQVTRVKVGQQVVVDPAVSCHNCQQCRVGREHTCMKLKFLGCPGQMAGCLCEYVVMPQECLWDAQRLSADEQVLCEPFAIGVYAVKQAQIGAGERIAILGAGPIGLSVFEAAKAAGVGEVFVTDKVDERVELARSRGAVWAGNPEKCDVAGKVLESCPGGVDVVFECAGEQQTLDEAVDMLRCGGKLMIIGIPEVERVSFVIDKIRRKEITIVNVRRQNNCTAAAIDMVSRGEADIEYMVTHRFEMGRAQEAFEMVSGYRDGVIKAMIEIE